MEGSCSLLLEGLQSPNKMPASLQGVSTQLGSSGLYHQNIWVEEALRPPSHSQRAHTRFQPALGHTSIFAIR